MFAIDKVRAILNKAYGTDVTYLMSDVADAADSSIPTGIVAFDSGLLGIGGIPRGHFVELAGEEKAGKTTMVLHMIAGCQAEGLVPLVIDPKGAVTTDVARAERIGVDTSSVIVVPVDTSDEALQRARSVLDKIKKESISIAFFWDDMGITPSEAQLRPGKDKTTGRDKSKPGAMAKAMWDFCRGLAGACYRAGAPMVVVNQITAVIATGWDAKFKPKETTAAGGGLKYTARIRVMLRSGKKIKGKSGSYTGKTVYATTLANAFFQPERRILLHLNFRNGYDSRLSSVMNATDCGAFVKKNGLYRVKGSKRGTKGVRLSKIDDELLWKVESKMWPWMDTGESGDEMEDSRAEEECEDEKEAEEDEFAEGYLD